MSKDRIADHAKAVELYERFKGAEWWPVLVYDHDQGWTNWGDRVRDSVALSAIAWAMVAHLYANGGCELASEDPFGKGPVCYAYDNNAQGTPHYGATPFLALAAAVEGME